MGEFPNEILSQHTAILGKTGSGKSSTHELMLEKITAKLARSQADILRVLCDAWPKPLHKALVAERVGASPSSSAFANNLGRLRSLGLIDYPASGEARAEDRMFPGGRR